MHQLFVNAKALQKNIKLRIFINAEPECFKLPENFKIMLKISQELLSEIH